MLTGVRNPAWRLDCRHRQGRGGRECGGHGARHPTVVCPRAGRAVPRFARPAWTDAGYLDHLSRRSHAGRLSGQLQEQFPGTPLAAFPGTPPCALSAHKQPANPHAGRPRRAHRLHSESESAGATIPRFLPEEGFESGSLSSNCRYSPAREIPSAAATRLRFAPSRRASQATSSSWVSIALRALTRPQMSSRALTAYAATHFRSDLHARHG